MVGRTTAGNAFGVAASGTVQINFSGAATTNGVCHSGANINSGTDTGRMLVACSSAPSDIAEWYEVRDDAEAGELVATSEELFTYEETQSNPFTGEILSEKVRRSIAKLERTREPYQRNVLGVIATSPFQVFGADILDQGTNPKPVTLIGRVPVKVNLEGGPIRTGDRLTASSQPGVAMRATKEGMTIGIALEPYDGHPESSGVKKIMVFISLGWSRLDFAVTQAAQNPSETNLMVMSDGRVALAGDLNLNGKRIVNVKSIASDTGKWAIDEDGRLVVEEVKTKRLVLYDEETGEPYCVKIRGGVLTTERGECAATMPIRPIGQIDLQNLLIGEVTTTTATTTAETVAEPPPPAEAAAEESATE